MKKYSIYLINNQSLNPSTFLLSDLLQKALFQTGLVSEITDLQEKMVIEEDNIKDDNKLKSLEIHLRGIDKNEIKRVWRVNLEQEIKGISGKNMAKTPETALLFLQKKSENLYCLHILLIEMKTSLKDSELKKNSDKTVSRKPSTLETIIEKFQAGINRMYLYLSIGNHEKENSNCKKITIYLAFNGLVCYNRSEINKNDNTDIFQIFANPSQKGLLTIESILNSQDKIQIHFAQKNQIWAKDLII